MVILVLLILWATLDVTAAGAEVAPMGVLASLWGIPSAFLAKRKGQSFLKWWLFGVMMPVIAIPYAAFFLQDRTKVH